MILPMRDPITIRLKIGGVIVATDTATSGNGVFAGTLTVPDVEEATLATVEVVANGKIQAFVPIDIAERLGSEQGVCAGVVGCFWRVECWPCSQPSSSMDAVG